MKKADFYRRVVRFRVFSATIVTFRAYAFMLMSDYIGF